MLFHCGSFFVEEYEQIQPSLYMMLQTSNSNSWSNIKYV